MTIYVFLLCLGVGAVCGTLEGALSPARKRLNIVFTILTDVGISAAAVGLHAVVSYLLCDGRFFFYAIAAEVAAFVALAYTTRQIIGKIGRKTKTRQTLADQDKSNKKRQTLAE